MKGKYKVLRFVGVSLGLVVLLLAAMIPTWGQDAPSKEIVLNLRYPQAEIIELAGPLSLEECEHYQEYVQTHKDALRSADNTQVLVGMFVQEFVYTSDLIDDILYRDIRQDGTVKIGVTSQESIEEFKELGIPITFEVIDLAEVKHLVDAAQEIAEKSYVMGARYDYSTGRIRVTLTKPNWDFCQTLCLEYPDSPLLLRLVDIRLELDHGGGEVISVESAGGSGTSGFLANWYGENTMVTAGHNAGIPPQVNKPVRNEAGQIVGDTKLMKIGDPFETPGFDAGFYTAYSGVTFNNLIEGTLQIDGWAEVPPNVDDWIYYTSGFRGSIWCRVTDVTDNFLEYWRSDGGPGDSGSPVFTATGGILIQGVHTHGSGEGYGTFGWCTTIAQVQDLLGVSEPGYQEGVIEDFEWGSDGDSLATSGGDITWKVLKAGSSVVEIDTGQKKSPTRSGHWYRAGIYDGLAGYFYCPALDYIGYYFRTDWGVAASTRHMDGTRIMEFRVTKDGSIEYEYATGKYTDTGYDVTRNQWHLIEARNIDWEEGTYDIYADNYVVKTSAPMRLGSGLAGVVFDVSSVSGTGNIWIDDIHYARHVIEDFEWGNDEDSLSTDGGDVDWTVSAGGASYARIDDDLSHLGTRSAKIYRDGTNNVIASYPLYHPAYIGFYFEKDGSAYVYLFNGDTTKRICVLISSAEQLWYYDTTYRYVCTVSADTWHRIEFRDINWSAYTYDIYVDGDRKANDVGMQTSSGSNGNMYYYAYYVSGTFWIDDIFE